MKAIINACLVTSHGLVNDGAIIFDHKILSVGKSDSFELNECDQVIDARGAFVGPGLIDIHIHGIAGADTMDGSENSLRFMSQELTRYGVTSFLPTTMSAPWATIEKSLAAVHRVMQTGEPGAEILGAHLEGPFLCPARAGAHHVSFLSRPDFERISSYLNVVRIVVAAPELEGYEDFLVKCRGLQGLVIAIGHTDANFEQACTAISRGARHATHLFNAMSPLHHREPGVVGAILTHSASAEVIADDVHIHPSLYSLLWRCLGPEMLILVSDAMRGAGLENGEYDLGGQVITVSKGQARLPTGQLAGSILTLNKAVHNFRVGAKISLVDAVNLASRNPAHLLGLKEKGALEVGRDADIIVFDDQVNIKTTFVSGEMAYKDREWEQ